jgi:hypothetical protein
MCVEHVHPREGGVTERIHLVVDRAEKERFRRLAEREGKTLSGWLRDAANARAAASQSAVVLDDIAALRAFFDECDQREHGREPDWESHLEVIDRSRSAGGTRT